MYAVVTCPVCGLTLDLPGLLQEPDGSWLVPQHAASPTTRCGASGGRLVPISDSPAGGMRLVGPADVVDMAGPSEVVGLAMTHEQHREVFTGALYQWLKLNGVTFADPIGNPPFTATIDLNKLKIGMVDLIRAFGGEFT